jgi:hypothetical protein
MRATFLAGFSALALIVAVAPAKCFGPVNVANGRNSQAAQAQQ